MLALKYRFSQFLVVFFASIRTQMCAVPEFGCDECVIQFCIEESVFLWRLYRWSDNGRIDNVAKGWQQWRVRSRVICKWIHRFRLAVLEFRQFLSIEICGQRTLVGRLARLFSVGIGAPRISTNHFLTTLMNTSFCWRTTRDKSVIYSRMFFTAKNMLIL